MTTVTLSDRQMEQVRRAILKDAAGDMQTAERFLRDLASTEWPTGQTLTLESDALHCSHQVRETIGLLDALGWPSQQRIVSAA